MADESATYLEDLLDLEDDDLDALTITGAGRSVSFTADEARSQGRRKRLTVPDVFLGRDFKEDDDLIILANQLIAAHETTLGHCRNLRIAYLWKKKGGGKGGKGTLGKCQSLSGVAQHWGRADILIWLAADHCTDLKLTGRQLEALLFNQLLRIGWDADKGVAVLVDPDAAFFLKELEVYGLWQADLERAGETMHQLRLGGPFR